jgi:ATP-dependent DNA helicase PIF1
MNKGKRWSTSENDLLISQIFNNNTLNDLSIELGRTKGGIIKQLEKLLLQKNIDPHSLYEQLLLTNIKSTFSLNNNLLSEDNSDNIENTLIQTEINFILNDIIYEIEEIKDLNEEQLLCYQQVKNGKNLLITGSSGVGKSMVLKSIIKYLKLKNKKIGVTSSTGISATLINGTTIHSFLKIGIATKSAQELYDKIIFNKPIYNKLKKLEVLIIDEISMIDNVIFNKIAAYLSLIKGIKKPFGKIQLILCGDFYQLPPVENTYCFNSNIWNRLNLQKIELKKQMRQIDDTYFQYLLEQVKINNITDDILSKLSTLKNKSINQEIKPTILYSKNVDVDKINQNEFLKLVNTTNNKVFEFLIKFDESNSKIKTFIKNNSQYLETLKLCKGLQIMVTHNVDIKNKITNGTRGVIIDINNSIIKIKTLDGTIYNIEYTQYKHDLDNNITFSYIPLKLAYAITINKSQGQTLDYILINLGKDIFNYGMAYVALSRAKTLDSVILSDLSRSAFKTNPEVIEFYKNFK